MVELFNTGSVNKAAQNLFTSPQNISRVKKKLEKEFHTKLFNRTSKGLIPTESGMIFIRFCQHSLSEYNNTLREINQTENNMKLLGQVSIIISPYIMESIPNDVFLNFKIKYPGIKLNIIERETLHGCEIITGRNNVIGIFFLDFLTKKYSDLHIKYFKDVNLNLITCDNQSFASNKNLSINYLLKDKLPIIFYCLTNIKNADIYQILGPEIIFGLNYDMTSNSDFYNSAICSAMYTGFIFSKKHPNIICKDSNISLIELTDIQTNYNIGFVSNTPFESLPDCTQVFLSFLEESFL